MATFDDLPLAADSYWNGADKSGGFVSGGASFENFCEPEWNYWEGFAYSSRTDPNARGYEAQYNAISGSGQGGSANYGVVYVGWESLPKLTFAHPQSFSGLYVTNNCYGYYDLRDGGTFGKKFGGKDGNDPDWFMLTITGIDANDQPTGTVEFYLADFRFDDNARDYIVDAWTFVDLASLGEVKALQLALSSSDVNNGGMKTPAYVCIDTILPQFPLATFDDLPLAADSYWNGADKSGGFVSGGASFENFCEPEWNYWEGFAYSSRTDPNARGYEAQYNAISGSGQGGSANYGVVYVGWESLPKLTFAHPQSFSGLYVTNNCYGYYDLRDGGTFGKKFGGKDGNDPDWFMLTITGIDANDQPTGAAEFYLADYRFDDNTRDYIVDAWTFLDLAALGEVKALQFALSSSDVNNGGMKTPAYVCIDTIVSGIGDDSDATNEQATDSTAILPGDNP